MDLLETIGVMPGNLGDFWGTSGYGELEWVRVGVLIL